MENVVDDSQPEAMLVIAILMSDRVTEYWQTRECLWLAEAHRHAPDTLPQREASSHSASQKLMQEAKGRRIEAQERRRRLKGARLLILCYSSKTRK